MLRANPAFTLGDRDPGRERFLLLILIVTCSIAAIGCSMLAENSSATPAPSPAEQIKIQTPLPDATIGKSYAEVLAVSGGQAPYRFWISGGTLPAGLTLNAQTGSISGVPTRLGDFNFTLAVDGSVSGTVNGETAKGSGTRSYSVAVKSCSSCVTVQVSPANPSVTAGTTVRFSAVVTNTSNPAVIWVASGGSISTNGVFTAPSGAPGTVVVTATSVAQPSVVANTTVTVTAATSTPTLSISTSTVPSGLRNTTYSASLSATGGKPPYRWTLVSGSLPGVALAATTGGLSGSPTQAGSFPFSVSVTDSASNSARQSYTLDVTNASTSSQCGPPAYNCSRTDYKTVQVPSTVPNVGNLIGANKVVTDPDFTNPIVRITDWNTDSSIPEAFRSYVSATSGSADENLWNLDSSMFVIQSLGSAAYPYTFDPASMQAARMYVSANRSSGGLKLPDAGTWSRVDPNLLYANGGTALYKYDFTDRQNAPSAQLVFDYQSGSNCLPANFNVTWKTKGGVSAGDTVFGMGYSNSGNQGTAVYAVVYKVGSGCSALNTRTGQITGDWGVNGSTMNIPDRWMIHNVKVSKDGNWLIIAPQSCLSSVCRKGPYFWQIGTTNVSSCGDGKKCGGHWTEGYDHWVNNYDIGNQVMRPFGEVASVLELTRILPPNLEAPLDEHLSWNNADPADSLPFFVTTWSPIAPFPAAFYNEILGVAADGSGKIWRFSHSYITSESPYFSTAYGIGSVSQDGRYFIFSSDWMGTLGSQSGGTSCNVKKNCRGDVFIVQLN
jgi:Putative Ig domain